MPRAHLIFVMAIAALVLTSGCSGVAPTPAPAATPEATLQSTADTPTPAPTATSVATTEPSNTPEASGYPAPTAMTRPGYPGPEGATAAAVPPGSFTPEAPTAPAPTEGQGVVTGTLTRDIRGMPLQPFAETTLFLAEVLRDANGQLSGLAGLDEETAPRVTTDANGQFAFTGVEPGLYLLIIKTPLSVAPVQDANAEDVSADVVAGEVAELGIIRSALAW